MSLKQVDAAVWGQELKKNQFTRVWPKKPCIVLTRSHWCQCQIWDNNKPRSMCGKKTDCRFFFSVKPCNTTQNVNLLKRKCKNMKKAKSKKKWTNVLNFIKRALSILPPSSTKSRTTECYFLTSSTLREASTVRTFPSFLYCSMIGVVELRYVWILHIKEKHTQGYKGSGDSNQTHLSQKKQICSNFTVSKQVQTNL